jgi:hypothetical protein
MNTLEILKAGRALIADPKNWCQGTLAKNNLGEDTDPLYYDACCWCSVGALRKAVGDGHTSTGEAQAHLYRALPEGLDDMAIVTFNDTQTHAKVLAMWDKAIQNATR